MAKTQIPLFVVSDENVKNSYGFYVDTEGIDLEDRFLGNPICLNAHINDNKNVLGTWKDIEKKAGKLMMRPDFDTEDSDGKEVVRKVLAGKIRGASIGIMFDPNDLEQRDGRLVLTKSLLFEVSIVPVPSNGGAVALFNMKGEQYTDTQIRELKLKLQAPGPSKPKPMNLITQHLNLDENTKEEKVLESIKAIQAQLTASQTKQAQLVADKEELTTALNALKAKNKDRQKEELTAELAAALKDGRINADSKEAIADMEHQAAMKLLQALPKRKSIVDQIKKDQDKFAKLSWHELDKKDLLTELKRVDFALFKEKYEGHFGKPYQD